MKPWPLLVLALAGCGDDGLPPLTNATSLDCPFPGDLPFRTMSHEFASSTNAETARTKTRSKSEASDSLGNPGGVVASTYLTDTQTVSATAIGYHGVEARTDLNGGLIATDLPGEPVSLWTYDDAATAWHSLARGNTADDGSYDLDAGDFAAAPGTPVYAMLEGDGSCAAHYTYLLPRGRKVVVTDIDGTLTTDDNELIHELTDGTYQAAMKTSADRLMQTWASKGYTIVYLTARPHLFRAETRAWLTARGFPPGPVITAEAIADASAYKTVWLRRLSDDLGWTIVAAYGNADTDISAYANDGIAKSVTFIIGPLAGTGGTVAIANDDYTSHISSYVMQQPDQP